MLCCVVRMQVVLLGRTHLIGSKVGDRAQPCLLRTHMGTPNLGSEASSPSLISLCLSGTSCLHLCCSRLPVPFSSFLPPSFASPGPGVTVKSTIHMRCSTTNR